MSGQAVVNENVGLHIIGGPLFQGNMVPWLYPSTG